MLKALANLTKTKQLSFPDPWISSKSIDECTWIGPGTLVWKLSEVWKWA